MNAEGLPIWLSSSVTQDERAFIPHIWRNVNANQDKTCYGITGTLLCSDVLWFVYRKIRRIQFDYLSALAVIFGLVSWTVNQHVTTSFLRRHCFHKSVMLINKLCRIPCVPPRPPGSAEKTEGQMLLFTSLIKKRKRSLSYLLLFLGSSLPWPAFHFISKQTVLLFVCNFF